MGKNNLTEMRAASHYINKTINSIIVDLSANLSDAITVGGGVAPGTPEKTGRARGGWRTTLNQPTSHSTEAGPGPFHVESHQEVRSALRMFKLGDQVHLANNVPYIHILEGGRRSEGGKMVGSTQAPDGFVRHAILEAIESFATSRTK